jgi:hypothetical protein
MFFIYRRTYTATAGYSSQLDYVCALCGTRAVASVQAQGTSQSTAVYGVGGSADQASYGAHYAAQANAYGALQHAPCPHCGGYQPVVTSRYAAFGERVARAKKRALPIAAAVAAVTLLLGIVPAIRDLQHSSALLVTMILAALGISGIIYAVIRSPGPRPQVPWGAVHFWWARPEHPGSGAWVSPPHVPPPPLPPPSAMPALGGTFGGLSVFGALIALIAWGTTFESVYVVDYEDRAVTIDGIDVTSEATTYGFDDKHVRKFSARTGKPHDVVIGGATYVLPDNHNGWVVAPEAKQHDVCFAEYESVYGGTKGVKPRSNKLELHASGVIVLIRSYDDMFKDSPKTQDLKSGETRRRWELRTVSCESFEEDRQDTRDTDESGQPL